MKISDKIREWCDRCRSSLIYKDDLNELCALADRIDKEMVELPKDAEGREIPLDTRVLYSGDGVLRSVRCFCYHVGCTADSKWVVMFKGGVEGLTSKMHIAQSDSLERIAEELEGAEKWCDKDGVYGTGIVSITESKLREWSDRVGVEFELAMAQCAAHYRSLIKKGMKPEDARYVLPEATMTNIAVTMNLREFMSFYALRTDKAAQWEIRELAEQMLDTLESGCGEWEQFAQMVKELCQ